MVPWIIANDGPPVDEVCRRFGCTPEQLAKDLELLPMCGVAPFSPDELIEADIEDGRVFIRLADWFERPLRLNHLEALTIVAAGASLLVTPGSDPEGPLARALDKLSGALGVDPDEALEVDLGSVDPDVLAAVRAGVDERRRLRIAYYSYGRDATTERTVDPVRAFSAQGQWYLRGWCHLTQGSRLFRIDRIRHATVLDEPSAPPPDAFPADPDAVFEPTGDEPILVLDLDPSAAWVAEQYPNEGVQRRRGGRLRIKLRAGQRAWVERLLLRLGDLATVVEGDASVGRDAARRVLARYDPR